jgi:biopolymer transport protein ExbD
MKHKKRNQDINAGSMADIAFLLLVFFLVVTTMKQDYGITSNLAEAFQVPDSIQINSTSVLLNNKGEVMVDNQSTTIEKLPEFLSMEFHEDIGVKNVVVLTTERNVDFQKFITTLDHCKRSFKSYYQRLSEEIYNADYNELTDRDKSKLQLEHPVGMAEEVLEL